MILRLRIAAASVGTTIFTVMSKLAADLGAINLSQGFPDFDCDPALVDAVARHMRAGATSTRRCRACRRCARRSPRSYEASTAPLRPRHRSHGHLGRHRSDLRRRRRGRASGDEGSCSSRATTPTCPAIELSGGRRWSCRCVTRLPRRLGRRARARHAAHAPDHDQLAAQSDRRRAGRRRHHASWQRSSTAPTSRRQRRSLRAHHLRRRAAREHGAPSRRSRRAASSSDRSARPITRPAGRSATPSRPPR